MSCNNTARFQKARFVLSFSLLYVHDLLIVAGSHPEVGALCSGPSVIGRRSDRRVEDGAVQSRPGDSKAGGYFSNRDVGSFEQCLDGLEAQMKSPDEPAADRQRVRSRDYLAPSFLRC